MKRLCSVVLLSVLAGCGEVSPLESGGTEVRCHNRSCDGKCCESDSINIDGRRVPVECDCTRSCRKCDCR